MSYIEIQDVSKSYASGEESHTILSHISLSIEKGEFVCLLGPSGCGKTTLMNLVAGFEKADAGSITIHGEPVNGPKKDYVTIFQNYGLLPWLTVEKNVMLGLSDEKLTRKEKQERAEQYLREVGLYESRGLRPGELSGGMQQRVAIARALAVHPEILFMDEPFAALDALTRMRLQDDMLKLSREEKKTILFVTHDIEEAVFLADRIVILKENPGEIRKIVKVPLGKERDRTWDEFQYLRDHILRLFEAGVPDRTEYYI